MKKIILLALTIFLGCVKINAQTLNEGFENLFVPNDWTLYSYGSSPTWGLNPFTPIQGNWCARIVTPGFPGHDDWLITPKLSITSATDSIKFFLRTNSAGSTQGVNVLVSTTGQDTASFTTIIASNVDPVGTGWEQFGASLSAFNGQDIYVGFHAFKDATGNMYLDSITGPDLFIPTCPTISFVDFGVPTYNSVTATWDSIANGEEYNYSVFNLGEGPAGIPVKTGTSIDTTEFITGLPSATDLELWITTDCGTVDGLSEVDGPFPFSTVCGPNEIEFTQNFDSYVPICWTEGEGVISDSTIFTSTFSDWTNSSFLNEFGGSFGSGASFRYDAFFNGPPVVEGHWLMTSALNLDSIPNSQLSFFIGMTENWNALPPVADFDNKDIFKVVISLDDGITWADSNVLLEYDSVSGFPSFSGEYKAFDLSMYSGLVKIGFYTENDFAATTGIGGKKIHIDDVHWGEKPACDIVSNINVDSLSSDWSGLSWDTTSFATGFIVEYGTPGFILGTGTQIQVTNVDTIINGLSSNTSYEVYVAPICNSVDTGDFFLSVEFTTACSAMENYYIEDFSTFLPSDCWDQSSTVFTDGVVLNPSPASWGGANYLNTFGNTGVRISNWGVNSDWLLAEVVNLDSLSAPAQLEFDAGVTIAWGTTAASISAGDTVQIVISADGGNTWNKEDIIYSIKQSNQPNNFGRHYEIPLVEYSGEIRIAFYAKGPGSSNYQFHFDNYEISEAPSCLPTFDYTVVSVGDTLATISWSDINAGSNNFLIEYGPTGFAVGTGFTTTSTTTSVDLVGLDPVTEYDFYVRALCSATDTANYGDYISFETECEVISESLFEDFSTYLPGCWYEATGELLSSSTLSVGNSNWGPKAYLNSGVNLSAKSRVRGTGEYHWLISEPLFLGSELKQIEFDAGQTGPFNSSSVNFGSDDKFSVVISTDDGLTWSSSNVLIEFNDGLTLSNTGGHYTATLASYVNAGNVRIGFYTHSATTNQDLNVYVDNFQFEDLDTMAVDLAAIKVEVNSEFCVGDEEFLELIVENTGYVPVSSFSVNTVITGPQPWNNNQSFFPNIPVGESDTVVLRNLSTLIPGNYGVTCLISPAGDINAINNKAEGAFFVSEYPTVFAGSDETICEGESINLMATGAGSYEWSHGLSNGSDLSPVVNTTYVVTGTNASGCSTNDTVIISVETAIPPTINYTNGTLYTTGLYDSYEWYVDGVLVGTGSTYDAVSNNVTVQLVATTFSGCPVENTHYVETFGLDEISEIGLILSPNPVKNTLNISGDINKVSGLKIYDLQGRIVLDDILTASKIDVTELNTGLYILKGEKDGILFQSKFTKQ